MIRILIVDDQTTVRHALRLLLDAETDFAVAGEADDAETAIAQAARLQPDLVLLDVEMPHGDGISAVPGLRAVAPHAHIVVLTLYDDSETRMRAQAVGARAILGKRDAIDQLPDLLRALLRAL